MFNAFYLLFNCTVVSAVRWINHDDFLRCAYNLFTRGVEEVGFVGAELVGINWVKLDIKSTDVESGNYAYTKATAAMFQENYNEFFRYCIAGKRCLYKYLVRKEHFGNFLRSGYNNRYCKKKCKEYLKENPLPTGLINQCVENVLSGTFVNQQTMIQYIDDASEKLNAYFYMPSLSAANERQAQIVLKKTDGTYVATNHLKVQKENGVWYREGFENGGEIASDPNIAGLSVQD